MCSGRGDDVEKGTGGSLLFAQAAFADNESYGGGAEQQAERTRALIARLEQG